MMHKVIGVFSDRGAAMQAREDLTVSGFSAGDIDVIERPSEQGGEPGLWEKIKGFFKPGEADVYGEATRRGGIMLAVTVEDDRIQLCDEVLSRHNPVDIDLEAESWRKAGWQPGSESIPLAEEELKVGKRSTGGGGVRIHTHVVSEQVEQPIQLHEEKVTVQRRPADRPAGEEAFREQVIEARGMREEPVVAKEAHVVEEVSLGRESEERTETVRATLRKTQAEIEQLEGEYQRDFQRRLGGGNQPYQEYRPAYELGEQLALEPQMEGQPWDVAETRIRQQSERRFPGHWDRLKDSIRFGYEHALARNKPR